MDAAIDSGSFCFFIWFSSNLGGHLQVRDLGPELQVGGTQVRWLIQQLVEVGDTEYS